MSSKIYDLDYYKKFYEQLVPLLNGPNIKHADMSYLESQSRRFANKTKYGSYVWSSNISNRLAPKTVYLGSERVRLPKPTATQISLIKDAPQQLDKTLHLLKTIPFVHSRRQMGHNDRFNPVCDLYVSTVDPKNIRIAYMWASTMFPPSNRPGPNLIMIHIPEEHPLRQQILALPDYNLNIAFGTDYLGEDKKGFLRQAMWCADEEGMLGLHSGSKIVTARDVRDNSLKKYGVFLFGMTATGKSTWSCHQLGLDPERGEKTEVCQDDITFLCDDGSAFGSENNFYVKTDVTPDQQEAMFNALVDKSALLENIMMNAHGEIDLMDESLCGNGRAVVFRDKLRVRKNGKLIGISAPSINLPTLDQMDGLIFAFITRRNTIMPFAQELTPEQGVLAYLWGESTHSYASSPDKAGESVRIVGTDPFIIGSRGRKVNHFYDIIRSLINKYPGKVKFMMYNTGGMGEIIHTNDENGQLVKHLERKAERVPINLMAAIQRGDLRGANSYEKGILGTKSIVSVEGRPLPEYDVSKFYRQDEVDNYISDLVQGRKEYTDLIASEGLNPDIIRAAEKSFEIKSSHRKSFISVPGGQAEEKKPVIIVQQGAQVTRPRKPGIWRWR